MDITEEEFRLCKSISLDKQYVQPRVRMCSDKENKQVIKEFKCVDEQGAWLLFEQLMEVWNEVKTSRISN